MRRSPPIGLYSNCALLDPALLLSWTEGKIFAGL